MMGFEAGGDRDESIPRSMQHLGTGRLSSGAVQLADFKLKCEIMTGRGAFRSNQRLASE